MLDLEVLDCHQHVSTSALEGDDWASEQLSRVATMDQHNIDAAIVIPAHDYLRPRGMTDTRRVNDIIAMYRDACPQRFVAAVGVTEPLYGEASLAEVDRCATELGLKGMSLHARFQGVPADSEQMAAIVARCADNGIIPFIHAIASSPDEALWRIERLGSRFPNITLLVLDAFSSFEQGEQVLTVADRLPNLVFDTALSYSAQMLGPFIARHGAERLVLGTDLYSPPLAYDNQHLPAQLLEADISEANKRLIFAGNLRRILNLPA